MRIKGIFFSLVAAVLGKGWCVNLHIGGSVWGSSLKTNTRAVTHVHGLPTWEGTRRLLPEEEAETADRTVLSQESIQTVERSWLCSSRLHLRISQYCIPFPLCTA